MKDESHLLQGGRVEKYGHSLQIEKSEREVEGGALMLSKIPVISFSLPESLLILIFAGHLNI